MVDNNDNGSYKLYIRGERRQCGTWGNGGQLWRVMTWEEGDEGMEYVAGIPARPKTVGRSGSVNQSPNIQERILQVQPR